MKDYNEFMDYNHFNEETKRFINKAMDIYSTIMDDEITTSYYQFEQSDKITLSLLIAGFLVNGKLKEILRKNEDIKLENLLALANINNRNINKLPENEYCHFYYQQFDTAMKALIDDDSYDWLKDYEIDFLTPEIIVWSLRCTLNIGYFLESHIGSFYPYHPLFENLKADIFKTRTMTFRLLNDIKSNSDSSYEDSAQSEQVSIPLKQEESTNATIKIYEDKVWLLLDEIKEKFVGQEQAVEDLFYNIINNQQLAVLPDLPDGQRSIIFLDGPTGTGKTAITREITEKLGIPFTSSSITNYSATGYVGGNITDTLKELLRKANGDLDLAQRGIIVFDEFDKIAYSRRGGLEMKRAVQQQLLDL